MSEQLPRALVIMGDGTDSELLAEGHRPYRRLLALTGLDEANILMAMCASRQTEQCKVVAKINRRSLMDLVSSEGIIDSVVSARDVTTELIVQYVRAMEAPPVLRSRPSTDWWRARWRLWNSMWTGTPIW